MDLICIIPPSRLDRQKKERSVYSGFPKNHISVLSITQYSLTHIPKLLLPASPLPQELQHCLHPFACYAVFWESSSPGLFWVCVTRHGSHGHARNSHAQKLLVCGQYRRYLVCQEGLYGGCGSRDSQPLGTAVLTISSGFVFLLRIFRMLSER